MMNPITADLVSEAADLLSGSTTKPVTVEHLLALRNVIAIANGLLDHTKNHYPVDEAAIASWQRDVRFLLYARIR